MDGTSRCAGSLEETTNSVMSCRNESRATPNLPRDLNYLILTQPDPGQEVLLHDPAIDPECDSLCKTARQLGVAQIDSSYTDEPYSLRLLANCLAATSIQSCIAPSMLGKALRKVSLRYHAETTWLRLTTYPVLSAWQIGALRLNLHEPDRFTLESCKSRSFQHMHMVIEEYPVNQPNNEGEETSGCWRLLEIHVKMRACQGQKASKKKNWRNVERQVAQK